jgi:hypothetical protein
VCRTDAQSQKAIERELSTGRVFVRLSQPYFPGPVLLTLQFPTHAFDGRAPPSLPTAS